MRKLSRKSSRNQLIDRLCWTIVACILIFLSAAKSEANDLQIANVTLTGQNTTSDYTLVQFDMGWSNSWRLSSGPANWDAAWVFVKYRVGGVWHHATLNTTGQTAPSGSTVDISSDGLGAFIYRSAVGSDSLGLQGIQLRWNYGVDGVLDADLVDVKVFGIEMVYVTQGSFAAGTGGSESNGFTLTTINTAAATTFPTGTGGFSGSGEGGYPTGQNAPSSDSWPNGYDAFYIMKYELSQEQYVEFLNTLDGTQQANRISAIIAEEYMFSSSGRTTPFFGNGVKCKTAPVGSTAGEYGNDLNDDDIYGETADGQNKVCNYIGQMDFLAYADWAGLRPMTELEYEKACRGIVGPVANEFPWGTTSVYSSEYTFSSVGTENENITDAGTNTGNAFYNDTSPSGVQVIRSGIFASSAFTKNREETGGSFYGVMELGGSLYERIINIATTEGRGFDGTHGDGELDTNGDADVVSWPASTGQGVKGSYHGNSADLMRTSHRLTVTTQFDRTNSTGARYVRTAP